MKMSIDQALRKARSLSPEEAETLFTEILGRFPGNRRVLAALEALTSPATINPPPAEVDGAIALYRQGRFAEALADVSVLMARYERSEVLHNIAGALHAAQGRLADAAALYRRAVELAPDYGEAHNNLGNVLRATGQWEAAIASFDAALRLQPDFAEAHLNRGIALTSARRLDEAMASLDRAAKLDPRLPEAHNSRGNVLMALNRPADALAAYDAALALRPGYADVLVNRGNALKALQRPEEAVASYDAAIAAAPGLIAAHRNRGSVLAGLRRLDEALTSFEQALALDPGSPLIRAEIRNLHAHTAQWTADEGTLPDIAGPDRPDEAIPPFYMFRFADDPAAQLACGRAWTAQRHGTIRPAEISRRTRGPGERLRIGYFSADFHNHATMYMIAGMLEQHDRTRFEVHAFSYGPDVDDAMRRRVLAAVDAFHPIASLSDADAARLARNAGIDIAIDLKGHTQDNRFGIFAYRAAPVQAGYIGFTGTTGADCLDYLIADPVTVPLAHQPWHSERVVHLPDSYVLYDARIAIADRTFTRAELGLPEDGFVFCCFNNNYKITPAEYDIWMRLLARVPGSVLWLLKDNGHAAANLRREAAARGIDPDRIVFAERMPLPQHLARHRCADLFLDTFNVNAHTTTLDALWAGLPVVTKLGRTFVARVAGSILHAFDMAEMVTETTEAYEALALHLATDAEALAAAKAKVAANRLTTPLFDNARSARALEALYERMAADTH